jgi:protein ImuB
VALVAEQRSALRVQACTPRATRAGIRGGMTLAGARALLPELLVELHEPDQERQDLNELSQQLTRFAPAVAPLPPDAIAAELVPPGGATTLPTPEPALLERTRDRLALLGHRARVVVASDLFAARVLAAWARDDRVVSSAGLPAALAPLPLEALEPSPRLGRLLRDLGLRTVGELAALSAADVTGRFGAEGLRLRRLALGGLGSLPMASSEPDDALQLSWELPSPVGAVEPLLFVLKRLCGDLATQLEASGQGLVGFTLTLQLEGAGHLRLGIRTGRPMRDPEQLMRLLRRRLEGLRLDGPVVSLELALQPVPFAGAQEALLVRGQPREPLAQLAARLADVLGPAALYSPSPRDRWRPEAAWAARQLFDTSGRFHEPGLEPAGLVPSGNKSGNTDPDPAWQHEAWRFSLPLPRPALLLPEPRPVLLEPRLGPPQRVQLEGRWFPVRRCWGPELLDVEWWAAGIDRRYWAIELEDGRGIWVFRELGHAYLHGWFDQGSPAPITLGAS